MNEWGWKSVLSMLVLVLNAIRDLQCREIFLKMTLLYGAAGIVVNLCENGGDLFPIISSLIPGIFLILTAGFSRGKVGYGDGILLLATGIWAGFHACMMNLCVGLFLAAIWCIVCMTVGKMGRRDEIPFVPFLLLGSLCGLIL